jgi:hypothetical protein
MENRLVVARTWEGWVVWALNRMHETFVVMEECVSFCFFFLDSTED